MKKKIGDILLTQRLMKNLTLRQLDKLSGVRGAYISRIERNISIPSPETLKKLTNVLDLDYEEMLLVSGHSSFNHDIKLFTSVYFKMNKNTRLEMMDILQRNFPFEFENAQNECKEH